MPRSVKLREEREPGGSRHLWANVEDDGSVVIEGQDLGQGTEIISSDGEYEWTHTFAPEHVPALLSLLGGRPDEDVLTVLARFSDEASYELERRIRACAIPYDRFTWSG